MALLADSGLQVVAAQQRHSASQGLQVVAPSAAGAAVDQHLGMTAAQLVPVGKVAYHVLELGHALPVGRVGGAPPGEGVDIEVLTIQTDALLDEQLVNVIDQPRPGFRIAQV